MPSSPLLIQGIRARDDKTGKSGKPGKRKGEEKRREKNPVFGKRRKVFSVTYR
jgi:hypothetical protein